MEQRDYLERRYPGHTKRAVRLSTSELFARLVMWPSLWRQISQLLPADEPRSETMACKEANFRCIGHRRINKIEVSKQNSGNPDLDPLGFGGFWIGMSRIMAVGGGCSHYFPMFRGKRAQRLVR